VYDIVEFVYGLLERLWGCRSLVGCVGACVVFALTGGKRGWPNEDWRAITIGLGVIAGFVGLVVGGLTVLCRAPSPAAKSAALHRLLMIPHDVAPAAEWKAMSAEERLADVQRRREGEIKIELAARQCQLGDAVFIRIMKENNALELWLRPRAEGVFKLYKNYPIARWSGKLGPKLREGDSQAPEGLYAVTTEQLNPRSSYHLSMNIGYPNARDTALGRTGSLIMIHGKDVSLGCFAMTDPVIEEIYTLVAAALHAGQASVPVHCFPFRMTAERIEQARESEWKSEWALLLGAWNAFERQRIPPTKLDP
jgi:murein L,D-transpeptidase YafK